MVDVDEIFEGMVLGHYRNLIIEACERAKKLPEVAENPLFIFQYNYILKIARDLPIKPLSNKKGP